MAGDRWHSLPMPYDRSVSGRSKRNHHVWLAGYGAVRPTHSTQNDIWTERLHQTLKRWLGRQPAARTLAELQAQLDTFRTAYDEERPHRAIGRRTPAEAYRATPKARPAGPRAQGHLRLRYDTVDKAGAISLRRAGQLRHLKIGVAHARCRVLAIVDEHEVKVVDLGTGGYSRPTRSSRIAATGATNDETPADGRGPKRLDDTLGKGLRLSPVSRLMCLLCRDS